MSARVGRRRFWTTQTIDDMWPRDASRVSSPHRFCCGVDLLKGGDGTGPWRLPVAVARVHDGSSRSPWSPFLNGSSADFEG
jgi:hypothetical protein